MASFLGSAAAGAAFPSGRAPRLDSGRLPLAAAAVRGRGASVVAARRAGTGHGGLLAAKLSKAPARDVKAVCAKIGPDPEGDADPEGDVDPEGDTGDLETMDDDLSEKSEMLGMFIPVPASLTEEEKAVYNKLIDIAKSCIIDLYARDAKAECDPDTTVKPGYGDWEEIDRKRMQDFDRIYDEFTQKVDLLHASGKLLDDLPLPLPPAAVSDMEEEAVQEKLAKEKAVQEKLAKIAEDCIKLQADAMRRLSLKQTLGAYNFFWPVLLGFKTVAAAAKAGRCSWGLAMLIRFNLDAVTKMMSHACATPLHLPWVVFVPRKKDVPLPEDNWAAPYASVFEWRFTAVNSCEEAMIALLEDLYRNVKTDIDNIIKAAAQ